MKGVLVVKPGAKLLYPDFTIQHAGVITSIGGVAGHSHTYMMRDDTGHFLRSHLDQNLSACTAACLLVRTELYRHIGGMNESNLKVPFNDVNLCLRLLALGKYIVYSSQSVLMHYESKSRGLDDNLDSYERFMSEVNDMKESYPTDNLVSLSKPNFKLR